jgi:hypothetical protein
MVMVMRVIHAAPPSVRSARLPLAHVLSRDNGFSGAGEPAIAYGM